MNISMFLPILMLLVSNIFMTFAWYGHLKYPDKSLWIVVLLSWMLAFFEYCLVVPANRIGINYFSLAELKTIQEVITLLVFAGFSVFYMGNKITLSLIFGFVFILIGAALIFHAK